MNVKGSSGRKGTSVRVSCVCVCSQKASENVQAKEKDKTGKEVRMRTFKTGREAKRAGSASMRPCEEKEEKWKEKKKQRS